MTIVIDVVLVARSGETVDWVARLVGVGGFALGTASFVWQIVKDRRARHSAEVVFKIATAAVMEDGQIVQKPVGVVLVRNFGQAMTLERIDLDWAGEAADLRPSSYGFHVGAQPIDVNPSQPMDIVGLMAEGLSRLPQATWVAGESRQFVLGISLELGHDRKGPDPLPFVAVAHFSNGAAVPSNVVWIPRPGWESMSRGRHDSF